MQGAVAESGAAELPKGDEGVASLGGLRVF